MSTGPEEISHAISRLKAGRLVAFPTETVYGLGADALNQDAVAAVFAAKGRPPLNPLIVHVSGPEMARSAVREWTTQAAALAAAFWPGPLSIILHKSPRIPPNVTAGGDTVAVRCPDHPLTLALIEAFGAPLVGPSANPSGRISPTTAAHVRESFDDDLVYVLDGGPCRGGIESTVVDLTGPTPRVLRPGLVTPDQIRSVLGREVESSEPSGGSPTRGTEPLRSPGMLQQHYAPVSPTRLVEPGQLLAQPPGAVLLTFQAIDRPRVITMPAEPLAYAARLYSALRQADALHPPLIAVEAPPVPAAGPDRELWLAILDRLRRATA